MPGRSTRLARIAFLLSFVPVSAHSQDEASERRAVSGIAPTSLLVRVVDPEGRPIDGAEVATRRAVGEWQPPEQPPIVINHWFREAEKRTDVEGVVLVEGLPHELHWIAAGAVPTWCYAFSKPVQPGVETTLVLTPVPLERALVGIVRKPDGSPAGCSVRFVWDDRGQVRKIHTNTKADGSFLLLAPKAGIRGALLATTYRNAFRSAALDPVLAGTTNVALRLGAKLPFVLEIRDLEDQSVKGYATFSWELAGHRVRDRQGMARWSHEIEWERPTVPFHVEVRASGHEAQSLGQLDPDKVGPRLVIRLKPRPMVKGRVLYEEHPVPGASVSARLLLSGAEVSDSLETDERLSGVRQFWTIADAQGRFEFDLQRDGTVRLRAWSPEVGEGLLGPIELDLDAGELVVEITRPPGIVGGTVSLPPGRDPAEIWLTARDAPGYMPLAPDGSFRMPNMPPGPTRISIVETYDWHEEWAPVSSSAQSDEQNWFGGMVDVPTYAPDWLDPEPTFRVVVIPGETVEFDIDLAAPPVCRFEGQLRFDGAAPPHKAPKSFTPGEFAPAVTLEDSDGSVVSSTELAADGSFTLRAETPGTYLLAMKLHPGSHLIWRLRDRVELSAGTRTWSLDVSTGSLAVSPSEEAGVVKAFRGNLRWAGPDALRISMPFPHVDKESRVATFDPAPAGTVQLYTETWTGTTYRRERAEHGEHEIVAGERLTIRLP